MTNCFEVRIGFIAFLLAATMGLVLNMAYGQELNITGCEHISDTDAMAKENCLSKTNQPKTESPSMNRFQCIIDDGYYYEIDGIGHCVEN